MRELIIQVYDCQAIFPGRIVSTPRCPVVLAGDLSGPSHSLASFSGSVDLLNLFRFYP